MTGNTLSLKGDENQIKAVFRNEAAAIAYFTLRLKCAALGKTPFPHFFHRAPVSGSASVHLRERPSLSIGRGSNVGLGTDRTCIEPTGGAVAGTDHQGQFAGSSQRT